MIWFSDIFHKFPRLSRISTLFLILLVVFPTVFSDGCAFSRHAPDQSARISSGYEPDQADSVSSESTDNDNQRADSSSANAFDEFLLQLFRSEAAQNTINLHFSLSSPESYGITEVPISLGSISSQASKENRVEQVVKHYLKYTVLIIDEIGYLPVDKAAAYGFFQLIAARYEFRPTILTTNQSFSKWPDVFGDAVIANAIIDRLVHHCEIIKITGHSYRVKDRNLFDEDAETRS